MRSAGAQFLDVVNSIALYPEDHAELVGLGGDRFILAVVTRCARNHTVPMTGYVRLTQRGHAAYTAERAAAKTWRRRSFEEAVRTSPGWLALEVTAHDQNLNPIVYRLKAVR